MINQYCVEIRWGDYASSTRWFDEWNDAVEHWNAHINDCDLSSICFYRPDYTLFAKVAK